MFFYVLLSRAEYGLELFGVGLIVLGKKLGDQCGAVGKAFIFLDEYFVVWAAVAKPGQNFFFD